MKDFKEKKDEYLIDKYFERFGEYPPRLICTSYKNEIYQELMENALRLNIPIQPKDVENAFKNISIDIKR